MSLAEAGDERGGAAVAPGDAPRYRVWRRVVGYGALILLAVISVLPFVWMVLTSFKSADEVFVFPPTWLPDEWQTTNYTSLFDDFPMETWILNSAKVTLLVVAGQLLFCSMAAYAFARLEFPGRDAIFYLFLLTMLIPDQVTLVPNFWLMRELTWLDTHWALVVPSVSSALGVFLLRQYFMTIPRELEDAARIDGAGYLRVYLTIILPLSLPALASIGIFFFIWTWGDFLWPLIVINTPENMTLPVGMALVNDVHTTDWERLMAGNVISLIPLVVVYLVAQRYFQRGITLTGIKG
jgi:multiple sugar transport system permease protein